MKLQKYLIILLAGVVASGMTIAQPVDDNAAGGAPAADTGGGTTQAQDQGGNGSESDINWNNPDFRAYDKSLDSLTSLGDEYAANKLRLARSSYQTGKAIILRMQEDVKRYREESAESRHLDERFFWQTQDRKMREERVISDRKRAAKLEAVTYFTRAIYHLDEINSRKVRESDEYKSLLAAVYRDWVMAQYDIGNMRQTIDILERYIALDPKYEEEVYPHQYLASAYAMEEKLNAKYGGSEEDLVFYKKKKNQHLLRAAELMYQKGSPEYEALIELVNRDETVAVSPR